MEMLNQILCTALLVTCAYTDIKEKIIYTKVFLAFMLPAICNHAYSLLVEETDVAGCLFQIFICISVAVAGSSISKHTKEKIGLGDVYLLTMICFIKGVYQMFCILLLSSVLCSSFAIILFSLYKNRLMTCHADENSLWDISLPFAPFMLAADLLLIMGECN